ncbi:MAG: septum formation initiator family protein [Thermoanaerobaculia bacterium]
MSEENETPVQPWRSWLGVAVILMLTILAGAGIKSYRDLDAARDHEADLGRRVEAAKERILILDQRLAGITDDPIVLERLAREELGMVFPDDIVIVLPETEPDPHPETSPQS